MATRLIVALLLLVRVASEDEASVLTAACFSLDAAACGKLVASANLEVVSVSAPPQVPLAQFVVNKEKHNAKRVAEFCRTAGLGSFDCALLHRAAQQRSVREPQPSWSRCNAGKTALQRVAYLASFPHDKLGPRGVLPETFGEIWLDWQFSGAAEIDAWPDLVSRLLEEDMVVLDVGANRGDFTAALIDKATTPMTIFQFEPDDNEVQRLKERQYNGTHHIEIVQAAATDFDGVTSLFLPVSDSPHAYASLAKSVFLWKHANSPLERQVSALRLDTWARERDLKYVDLLKIDVEGADPLVLNGASQLRTGILLFEYGHLWSTGGSTLKGVVEDLSKNRDVYLVGNDWGLLDLTCWADDFDFFWWSNVLAVDPAHRPLLAEQLRDQHTAWLFENALPNLILQLAKEEACTLTLDGGLELVAPASSDFLAWRNASLAFATQHNFHNGAGCIDDLPCVADLLLASLLEHCLLKNGK